MTKANYDEELQKIENRIAELKKDVELGEALNALHVDNDNFKKVILEGYFEKEEERLTGLLFNPTKLKRDQMENVMDKATGIRSFKLYFQTLLINASMAPEQIEEEENYRTQLIDKGFEVEAIDG